MGPGVPISDMEVIVSGPPPKHPSRRARRNNPKADFRPLPADGRQGDAPPWPLRPDVTMTATLEMSQDKLAGLAVELNEAEDGRTKGRLRRQINQLEMTVATLTLQIEQATDAEVDLWDELWTTPQAAMWDESGAFNREVAQYVRWKIQAEQGDLKAGTEARLLSDRLGLNPLALLKLRREVEETKAAEEQGEQRRARPKPDPKPSPKGKGDDDPRGGLWAVS